MRAMMLLSTPLWSACVRRPAPVTPATASSPCAGANGIVNFTRFSRAGGVGLLSGDGLYGVGLLKG